MAFINKDQEAVPEMENSKFAACLSFSGLACPSYLLDQDQWQCKYIKCWKPNKIGSQFLGAALSAVSTQSFTVHP